MTATPHGESSRPSAVAGWSALVIGTVVTILLLHALGGRTDFAVDWSDPWAWLDTRNPEQAVLALGRVAALVMAYWVAGTTLVYTIARVARLPRLVRSVEWATLPVVRRMAERVVAVTITASTIGGSVVGVAPALATDVHVASVDPGHSVTVTVAAGDTARDTARDGGYLPVPAGDPPLAVTTPNDVLPIAVAIDDPYVPVPAGGDDPAHPAPPYVFHGLTEPGGDTGEEPHPVGHLVAEAPTGRPEGAGVAGAATAPAGDRTTPAATHTVVSGDNLWAIAAHHLEAAWDRSPNDQEIATYWSEVTTANRSTLRSGDPDLIHPGEVVALPPVGSP